LVAGEQIRRSLSEGTNVTGQVAAVKSKYLRNTADMRSIALKEGAMLESCDKFMGGPSSWKMTGIF
jgi:hypothetical protein